MITKNSTKASLLLPTLGIALFGLLGRFSPVFADSQCGPGWVCWAANGGSNAVYEGCEWTTGPTGATYCAATGAVERYCSCEGSTYCDCDLPGGATCEVAAADTGGQVTASCTCFGGPNTGDWCGSTMESHDQPCYDAWGPYDTSGTCKCTTENLASTCVLSGTVTIGCCYQESASPTPGGVTPTPGSGEPGEPTPLPYFYGTAFEDANAVVPGLGGTDNLCTGNTNIAANAMGGSATISRTGESSSISIPQASYNITAGSSAGDYTVTLDLPFPPPDPNNAWQCACNADPSDPYRCIYSNQQPSSVTGMATNFFVKRANLNNTAWWQSLGGNVFANQNIETRIPTTTCIPPFCTPALIGRDTNSITNSAGFPATGTGNVVTTNTGETYIHEIDGRDSSIQGKAMGVEIPEENYNFFYAKFGGKATTITNAQKPTPATNPGIYFYDGNLTISEINPWYVPASEQIIVFVNGDLTLDDTTASETRITTVAVGGFLQFIVNGKITVTSNVGYSDITTDPTQPNTATLEGVFVADEMLVIDGQTGTTDRKFIGAGTFVGWGGVQLNRDFDDGSSPTFNNADATETFIYRPDFLVNAPQIIKSAQFTWQEVLPQWPGN